MQNEKDRFSGRFGLILAALGMAIGTGNIWRFPRIAAEHGGGTFLIPWLIFLFTWSIPILIAEFTLGKATQRGPIGAFSRLLGRRAAWMGAFMAFVTLMIATYYSVVTGWTLRYAAGAIIDGLADIPAPGGPETFAQSRDQALTFFNEFAVRSPADPQGFTLEQHGIPSSLWFHLGAVVLASLVVWRGIQGGVELASKIMVPALFLLLIGCAYWVLTELTGAEQGLQYLFTPDWAALGNPKIWIDGLSQSAWSTGAGWGLILAYGASCRRDEDAVVTNRLAGLGNNSASMLAALFIFPAVFALLSQAGLQKAEIAGALKDNGPGNSGLAFTYIPFIFKTAGPAGKWLTIAFFSGLFLAALSSLIAMYEMARRVLCDMGIRRGVAVLAVGILCAGVGALSALDMRVFVTMDWVWGLALVIGGLAIAWAVQTYGADRFRRDLINDGGARRRLGPIFNTFFVFLIPAQGLGMLGWWLYDAATNPGFYGEGNNPWDPTVLGTYGVGPCVGWWVTALGLFWALSPWLGRFSLSGSDEALPDTDERPSIMVRPLGLVVAALPWAIAFSSDTGRWTDSLPNLGDRGWMYLGGAVGIILIGGFLLNACWAASQGPGPLPRPAPRPREILGRDEEHA